jgi:hypothetical protein
MIGKEVRGYGLEVKVRDRINMVKVKVRVGERV